MTSTEYLAQAAEHIAEMKKQTALAKAAFAKFEAFVASLGEA